MFATQFFDRGQATFDFFLASRIDVERFEIAR